MYGNHNTINGACDRVRPPLVDKHEQGCINPFLYG